MRQVTPELVRIAAETMLDGLVKQLPASRRFYAELASVTGDPGWRERVRSVFRAEQLVLSEEFARLPRLERFRLLMRTVSGEGASEPQVTSAVVACLAFVVPGDGDEIAAAWRALGRAA